MTRRPRLLSSKIADEPAEHSHRGDGSDAFGRELEVAITISPDGTVLFGDLTADLLPVAAALCPNDRTLQRRIELAGVLTLTSAEEKQP
jgi:hypothetical protein